MLLLISHDRALLEDVCDKIIILDGEGNTRVFEGRYSEWEAKQKAERAAASERERKPSSAKSTAPKLQASQPLAKASAERTSAPKLKGRFTSLPIEKIEKRIADIGRELRVIDGAFADPKVASDTTKTKKFLAKREELQKEQSDLEEEWIRKSG